MFELIPFAPPDPILGLADLYKADNRPNKINLGVGVYQNENGFTPIFISVKKAEEYLIKNEITKNYLSIDGIVDFAHCTQKLLFSNRISDLMFQNRICTIQTPGGTGALRVIADFLANQTKVKHIWISNPSWPNHQNIFHAVGLKVNYYRYYDHVHNKIDFDGMISSLQEVKKGDVVLFHGCCHNPTGVDPTIEQWKYLAQLSQEKEWLPLFDVAYQGFAYGIDKDAEGVRIFSDSHKELIIVSSYSKNFGLYNERVGALTLIAENEKIIKKTLSQVKYIIRSNYSNPPSHGAAVVSTILKDNELKNIWQEELINMRQRIKFMRQIFVTSLKQKGIAKDFEFIIKQNGMFSLSGLNYDQILKLREKFGIYVVNSGRLNMAGITLRNISTLCEAIIEVT